MPTFDSLIDRSGAEALMPEEASREILQSVTEGSTVIRLARRLPNMARGVRRLPILSVLPQVYFVGEAGRQSQTFNQLKQTAEIAWANKFLNAEEVACIVPIPESVLEDADYDVWEEIRPQIVAAIGAQIDAAMLFGVSNSTVPAAWPDGIIVDMPSGHQIVPGSVGDLYDDIMAEGGVLNQVEEDGYFVDGHIAALKLRAKLRGLREPNDGRPIFVQDMKMSTPYALDGVRLEFPRNGGFDPTQALLLSGDWTQVVWALRKDISYKVLTEGVITDNSEPRQIIHNLAQDDMVALRVVFRMAWNIANPINRVNPNSETRYPFAALVPAGS